MSETTSFRLKNRSETPNGGWQYFQPQTVWSAPFNYSDTFDVCVRKIMYHRSGNSRFNLPTDFETVAAEFEAYMCKTLIDRGLGEEYVVGFQKKTSPLPNLPKPTSTMQRAVEAVAALVAEVRKDAVGAASLAEWVGAGSIPVSQEQADSRAAICLKCPQNQGRRGRLRETVATAIKNYTQVKSQIGLRAEGEAGLKTCAACDCPLKLKVWVPLRYILSHTNPGIFPDNCWVPRENLDPPAEPPVMPEVDPRPTITISRWGAFGDVITATAIASRIKAHGFNIRFATHKAMMPALEGHPDIAELVEHGTVTPDINLDGAYEKHPDRNRRPMLALFEEAARKQVRDPDAVLGSNGHYRPSLVVTGAEKEPYLALFKQFRRPWVVIVPKSGRWKNRSVPDETWKETAALVNGTCFWTGYERIESPIIDLGTRDFRRVMAAVSCADLVVTVDTGPMHVAAALNIPILAIQQAFDLSLRLSADVDWTSFSAPLTCLKCGEFECPIDKLEPPCTKLDPAELARAINQKTMSREVVDPILLRAPARPEDRPNLFDRYIKGRISRAVNPADYVTVVLMVHQRHEHLESTFQSILEAGFKNIVITASGITDEIDEWLQSKVKVGCQIMINAGTNNNECSINGVKEVTTPFTILFQAGDLMNPGYSDLLLPLVNGEADFSVCNAGPVRNEFLMKTGVRNSRVVHDVLLRQKLTLNPSRGCFPTGKLLDSLRQWRKHDGDKRFELEHGGVAGNDLLVWLNAVTILDRALVIAERCVSCPPTPSENEPIYQLVKEEHSDCRVPNYCGLGYIHNWSKATGLLKSIRNSPPGGNLIWFTDSPEPTNVFAERIPRIGPLPGGADVKFVSASIAFVYGLKLIRNRNIDWFMWLEHDCRFHGEDWLVQLWQENLSWNWNHVCSGSPVIWNLPGYGTRLATAWLPYFGKYASDTGFFPAFEGWGGGLPSAYPNGAIAWYHTETMCDWFSAPLAMDHQGVHRWCMENTTFDLYIGQQLIKRHGAQAAMKMGWLESSYSGCGDHYYDADFRRQLLSQKVIAMHQEKDNAR